LVVQMTVLISRSKWRKEVCRRLRRDSYVPVIMLMLIEGSSHRHGHNNASRRASPAHLLGPHHLPIKRFITYAIDARSHRLRSLYIQQPASQFRGHLSQLPHPACGKDSRADDPAAPNSQVFAPPGA
jgi:hypothetical protein